MKSIKHKALAAVIICMVLGISFAGAVYYQPNVLSNHPFLKNLAKKLALYQEHYAEEKVYLHFDKTFYEPGESIWFNAYVRDAHTFQPSKKSEVVYVELIAPNGSAEQKLTLIAQEGRAAGDFALAESLKGGLYTVKAYTQWQENTNVFFERSITIQKSVLPNLNMQLNFNRKAYGIGDEVAATLDLNTLTKAPLSEHAFTYVVALEGETIQKGKGKTNTMGRANLQFDLPKNLTSNDGLLNIMLQYKGQTESIARSIPIVLGNIDLQFFPEGGDLVKGVPSYIGFKALNEFGKPADIAGEIVDKEGNVLTSFNSYHQGMGKLALQPEDGKEYFAKITQPANISATYPLPRALNKGYALKVENQNTGGIDMTVFSATTEPLYIVAQSRNKIYFSKDLEAQEGANKLSISTTEFPIGITQVTLFDSKKIARAERLIFVNQDKQLQIKVTTDKEKYLPREKVNLTVEVTDERGIPMPGNFSIAVADDKLLNFADDKQGHLLSYMLLESDLKGEIVEPNFYFDNEKDPTRLKPEVDRKIALDHLMMTQGWRTFKWEEVSKLQPLAHAGEQARIAGTVLDAQGNPVEGIEVALVGNNKKIVTNAQGKFDIADWKLYNSTNVQVSGKDYFPITKHLNDYNNGLAFKLFKKRVITGVIKNKQKQPVAYAQIRAGGVAAVSADEKGKFEITIPDNIEQLIIYGEGTGYENQTIALKENVNKVEVVLNQLTLYLEAERSVALASASARGAAKIRRAKKGKRGHIAPPPPPPPAPAMIEEVDEELEELVDKIAEKDGDFDDLGGGEVDEPADVDVADMEEEVLDDEEFIELGDIIVADRKEIDNKVNLPQAVGTRYNRVREFPEVHYVEEQAVGTRTDFRNTIYWNPNVEVGKDGRAELSFFNSDAITQFRVTLEGFSVDGGLGRTEYKYFTQQPFEMLTKVPREVLTGDEVKIPLTLTNNSNRAMTGELTVELPAHIELLQQAPKSVTIAANSSKTILLQTKILNQIASGNVIIAFKNKELSDRFETIVDARPRGFPVNEVFTGDKIRQDFNLSIQEVLEGTMVARLQAYPNTLDEVMKGMESMLRMPGGCFEQTSSSNYPNLLVLDYLRETGTSLPNIEKQAMEYLEVGYKRLVGYESSGGGFDWWGRDPAHEALSAYGLMEFVDMKRVYPVDQALIDRTAKWLLGRKDKKGGWNKNPHALHSWAVAEVTDAYIVWAVTEAGYAKEIRKELDKSYKDAVKSEDPYMMALVANGLLNAKDSRANNLIKELVKLQKKNGQFVGLTSSVTNSTGTSLMVETTSLAVLAMLEIGGYNKEIKAGIKAIQGGKNYYGYGSTQGTVLALKALLKYAQNSKRSAENGTLAVYVDKKKVASLDYTKDQKDLVIENLADFLKDGKQKVTVAYENTKTAMPFDLEVTYTTRLPQNSPDCKLSIKTALPSNKVKMGETVRLTTTLSNTKNEGQPMTMAMVGIPAGLSLQPWQLKELQEKNVVDYYELFDGYVVFHYEQLKAKETKTIHLDLKADIPGQYEAPASSAFLYYTNEHRVWSMPERMIIQ